MTPLDRSLGIDLPSDMRRIDRLASSTSFALLDIWRRTLSVHTLLRAARRARPSRRAPIDA
jgi:hypothetical protein